MKVRAPRWLLLAAALSTAATACSAPRPDMTAAEPEPASMNSEGFSLILNNRHYLDVNVFVHHDGQASRVATVTGSSSSAVVVPRWMLGKGGVIRLIAEPIGEHSSYVTDNLVIQPGQIVELNVENAIARSNYSVQ